MLSMDDTIAAVSSASVPAGAVGRSIVRVSGPGALEAIGEIVHPACVIQPNCITPCRVLVDDELSIEGRLYAFFQPHSYTGQDLIELHLDACGAVVEAVLEKLYRRVRPAVAGEFTQRAFLNGKIDLTQAEAVAEIVSAANTTQLAAAERLLHGRFSDTIAVLRGKIIDLLGSLEAGLDFTEEDIEFISSTQAIEQVHTLKQQLTALLEGSVRCERMIDLDSVGLAGAPNAGKSSLLNALLGTRRSIVSSTEATTRDVLTGVLRLNHLDCVLFDCAGLMAEDRRTTLIDQLSHQASLTALNKAAVVLFCVDISKGDLSPDQQMRQEISAEPVVFVATKSDTLPSPEVQVRLEALKEQFAAPFLSTSTKTGDGLDALKQRIQAELMRLRAGDAEHEDRLTINQRHEQRLRDAIKALEDSADEINTDSSEIAAMLLRQAYELLGGLERENVSETILDRIFSHFCVGK